MVDTGTGGSAWQADWEDWREDVDGMLAPHQDVAYDDWLGTLVANRKPEDRLFARIPTALDIHAGRRWYAQTLYRARVPGCTALTTVSSPTEMRPHMTIARFWMCQTARLVHQTGLW